VSLNELRDVPLAVALRQHDHQSAGGRQPEPDMPRARASPYRVVHIRLLHRTRDRHLRPAASTSGLYPT
jgi:hypothetical protein